MGLSSYSKTLRDCERPILRYTGQHRRIPCPHTRKVELAAMTLATLQQGSNAVHTQVILSLSYEILGSHSSVAEG